MLELSRIHYDHYSKCELLKTLRCEISRRNVGPSNFLRIMGELIASDRYNDFVKYSTNDLYDDFDRYSSNDSKNFHELKDSQEYYNVACYFGNDKIFFYLIENYPIDLTFDNSILLSRCCFNPNLDIISYLIDAGLDTETAIVHFVIECPDIDIINYVMDRCNKISYECLRRIIMISDNDLFIRALEKNADYNNRNGRLLLEAVTCDCFSIAHTLMEHNITVPTLNNDDIIYIIMICSPDEIQLLIDYGVDFSVKTNKGINLMGKKLRVFEDNGIDCHQMASLCIHTLPYM